MLLFVYGDLNARNFHILSIWKTSIRQAPSLTERMYLVVV